MGLTSPYRTYYCKNNTAASSGNQLLPSPQLSIDREYYYANDIAIGYTYNIALNGYATSLDTRTYVSGQLDFSDVLSSIQNIKNIFSGNNGTLIVLNQDNNAVFKATGGTVRSLTFSESENNWVNYSAYAAEIEFNEVQLANCSGSGDFVECGSLESGVINSSELIDMSQYKVRSFNDNWSFELPETIYSSYDFVRNDYINATYTINAVGKHYFVNNNLIPSWEQAKNFVQYRLKNQVNRLIVDLLNASSSEFGCTSDNLTLQTVFGSGQYGLLSGLSGNDFGIYNEVISCQASEGDGSFSATYNCIIKRKSTSSPLSDADSIHTFTTSSSLSDSDNIRSTTISVNGNIQGLVAGGLVHGSGVFNLPDNGQILTVGIPGSGKYDNALRAYNKIGTANGLKNQFISLLGISYSSLGVSGNCVIGSGAPPNASHAVSHDYTEGIVSYRSSYTTERACGQNTAIRNIQVTVQDPTPIIQEFVVPGRSGGPIIQRLGIDNPKKVSISIDGVQPSNLCCPDISGVLSSGCADAFNLSDIPPAEIEGMKLTANSYTMSKDGSYSVNRSYIYCG